MWQSTSYRGCLLVALLPDAARWVQTFEREDVLHLRVHGEAATVSLFTGIISDLDAK